MGRWSIFLGELGQRQEALAPCRYMLNLVQGQVLRLASAAVDRLQSDEPQTKRARRKIPFTRAASAVGAWGAFCYGNARVLSR